MGQSLIKILEGPRGMKCFDKCLIIFPRSEIKKCWRFLWYFVSLLQLSCLVIQGRKVCLCSCQVLLSLSFLPGAILSVSWLCLKGKGLCDEHVIIQGFRLLLISLKACWELWTVWCKWSIVGHLIARHC